MRVQTSGFEPKQKNKLGGLTLLGFTCVNAVFNVIN